MDTETKMVMGLAVVSAIFTIILRCIGLGDFWILVPITLSACVATVSFCNTMYYDTKGKVVWRKADVIAGFCVGFAFTFPPAVVMYLSV